MVALTIPVAFLTLFMVDGHQDTYVLSPIMSIATPYLEDITIVTKHNVRLTLESI